DSAVVSEAGFGQPGLRIERDQLIAERNGENPLVVSVVGPISDAAIVEAHGAITALAFVKAIHPECLTGGAIHGYGVAAHSSGEIEDAIHGQRRYFIVRVRARAEV